MDKLPDITYAEYMAEYTEDELRALAGKLLPLAYECDCRPNPIGLWPRPCYHYDILRDAITSKTARRLDMNPPMSTDGFGLDVDLTSNELNRSRSVSHE